MIEFFSVLGRLTDLFGSYFANPGQHCSRFVASDDEWAESNIPLDTW